MAQNNNFPEKFIANLKVKMQQKVLQKQDKDENKKMQSSHTIVQKLENLPSSSNIPTQTLHSKAQTQYSNIQYRRRSIKTRTTT